MITGYSVVNLTFAVIGEVLADVTIESSDPRLIIRTDSSGKLRLSPNLLQSVSALAREPHQGIIRVRNSLGQVIAEAPYEVAAAKRLNQSTSLGYVPGSNQASLSYSVSSVPQSIFDLRLSASVGLGLNLATGETSGGVGINISW